jgi:hypothetical protein
MPPTKRISRAQLYEDLMAVQRWNKRLEHNGPLHPTPTIAQAQSAGYGWLIAECVECQRTAHVPFDAIRRPPATPIADLRRTLICTGCGQKGPPAVTIRGVALHADPLPDFLVITLPPDEDIQPPTPTITIDL